MRRRGWLDDEDFEDAVAACNLLPGPASTQLAIYCAWRLRGRVGALVGALGFIVPGLIVIIALAALFLATTPPAWVLGAGAGAGAAVGAVAISVGASLLQAGWARAASKGRWVGYVVIGGVACSTLGPWLVVVLLACGLLELVFRYGLPKASASFLPVGAIGTFGLGSGDLSGLAWVAFKVGALSYGGGFVIIPLMHADAVNHYHWLTDSQFLNAVALGQTTPGPVVHTVAVVGYGAAGLGGALFAALVAFAPSFAFIALGGRRFDLIRQNERVRSFLDGAAPATIGAIIGSAIPLTRALSLDWQYGVAAVALTSLFVLRRGVVPTLLLAGGLGAVIALSGGPVPT